MRILSFPACMHDALRFDDPALQCPPSLRSLVIAMDAPDSQLHALALHRLPLVVAFVVERTGETWNPSALEDAVQALPASHAFSRGNLTRRPLYAALCKPLADPDGATACCRAWTIALLGSFVLLWPVARLPGEDVDRRYRVSLAIRQLIQSPEWSRLEGPLPDHGPRDWQAQLPLLTVATAEADPRWVRERMRDIIALFKAQATLIAHPAFARRAKAKKRDEPVRGDGQHVAKSPFRLDAPDVARLTRLDDDDNDPGDAGAGSWQFRPATAGIAMALATDPIALNLQVQAAESTLMTRPTRPAPLTPGEFKQRMAALERLPPSLSQAFARASVLFVGLVGVAWEAMWETAAPLYETRWPDMTLAPTRAGLALFKRPGSEDWEGVRVIRNPTLPAPPEAADPALLYPVASLIGLPLHPRTAQRLAQALELLPGTASRQDASGCLRLQWAHHRLGRGAYDSVRKALADQLPRHRMEAGRLPQVMRGVLRSQPGVDESLLALLAPDPESEPATVTFYSCWPVSGVAQHYLQAQHVIESALDPALPERVPLPATLPWQGTEACMGSRRVPRPSAISAAWRALRQALEAPDGAMAGWTLGDCLAHHNAWVQRTAFVWSYGYGLRRSLTSLHEPIHQDLEGGFVTISDKGVLERTLHLTAWLRRHWDEARVHLEVLRTLLRTRSPSGMAQVERMLAGWHAGDLSGAMLQLLVHEAGANVRAIRWSPASLQQALAERGVRLPPQLLRHGARTHSLHQGAPEVVIDAMLGHYAWGREAWNPHSSWTMDRMARDQSKWIDLRLTQVLGEPAMGGPRG